MRQERRERWTDSGRRERLLSRFAAQIWPQLIPRAEILDYQRNAVDARYRWAQSIRSGGCAGLIESEPIEKPATPDKDAGLQEWQHYYAQMAAFTAWRISLEEWRGTKEP